jgi:hypothetical protein
MARLLVCVLLLCGVTGVSYAQGDNLNSELAIADCNQGKKDDCPVVFGRSKGGSGRGIQQKVAPKRVIHDY